MPHRFRHRARSRYRTTDGDSVRKTWAPTVWTERAGWAIREVSPVAMGGPSRFLQRRDIPLVVAPVRAAQRTRGLGRGAEPGDVASAGRDPAGRRSRANPADDDVVYCFVAVGDDLGVHPQAGERAQVLAVPDEGP